MLIQTVRTVKNDMPEGAYPAPNEFVHSGWCKYLPFSAIVVLHFASMNVMDGKNKGETIQDINETIESKKEPLFFDFNAPKPKGKRKLEEYMEDLIREGKLKRLLERNGYHYPRTAADMIDLFNEFGIIQEIDIDGVTYLDVLLGPYPDPKAILDIRREDHVTV